MLIDISDEVRESVLPLPPSANLITITPVWAGLNLVREDLKTNLGSNTDPDPLYITIKENYSSHLQWLTTDYQVKYFESFPIKWCL